MLPSPLELPLMSNVPSSNRATTLSEKARAAIFRIWAKTNGNLSYGLRPKLPPSRKAVLVSCRHTHVDQAPV